VKNSQKRFMNKHPEYKVKKLKSLEKWKESIPILILDRHDAKMQDDDQSMRKEFMLSLLHNPICEIDNSVCTVDDGGFGMCGDRRDGCIWNSKKRGFALSP